MTRNHQDQKDLLNLPFCRAFYTVIQLIFSLVDFALTKSSTSTQQPNPCWLASSEVLHTAPNCQATGTGTWDLGPGT